jgi:hypothetical protein
MIYDGYRRGEYNYKPTNTNEGSRRMDSLVAVFKTKAAMVWLIQANERIGRWWSIYVHSIFYIPVRSLDSYGMDVHKHI